MSNIQKHKMRNSNNIDWANLHLIKAPFVINETLQINSAIFANPLPPPVSII